MCFHITTHITFFMNVIFVDYISLLRQEGGEKVRIVIFMIRSKPQWTQTIIASYSKMPYEPSSPTFRLTARERDRVLSVNNSILQQHRFTICVTANPIETLEVIYTWRWWGLSDWRSHPDSVHMTRPWKMGLDPNPSFTQLNLINVTVVTNTGLP